MRSAKAVRSLEERMFAFNLLKPPSYAGEGTDLDIVNGLVSNLCALALRLVLHIFATQFSVPIRTKQPGPCISLITHSYIYYFRVPLAPKYGNLTFYFNNKVIFGCLFYFPVKGR